jgi:murein DD-endopeptidase MepM/ murein hydrolase activator NlpD
MQAGASGPDAAKVKSAVEPYLERGGNRLELTFDAFARAVPRLWGAKLTLPDGSGVELTRQGSRFAVVSLSNHLVPAVRVIRGEMDGDSFYTSAVAAGIDDRLVPDITSALAFEFDFAREIHKGDVFEIVVRGTINASGETIGPEKLVFVRLVTDQRSVALYRFAPSDRHEEWFDAGGRDFRRGLMRTPVEGARVSSYYGMRMHPVLGFMRMHKGVDFATPVGTPVYAAGDGTITVVGVKHGYGLYLRIDHSSKLATAYAHLSRYPPATMLGAHVHQGDVVAYTGNTGELSTGPHLHYEVLVNDVQVDPLGMPVEQGIALNGADLTAFENARDQIDTLRQKGT